MARSKKKGFYFDQSLLRKVNNIVLNKKKKIIITWSRKSTIIPEFIDFTFLIHNGKKHIPVFINKNMLGYKLGEFSFTRKFKGHSKSKDKKNLKKKIKKNVH